MNSRTVIFTSFVLVAAFGAVAFGQSGSKSATRTQQRQLLLGQSVSEANAVSIGKIDHSDWNKLLQKYVNQSGAVDYAQWKNCKESSQLLDKYINQLSSASLNKSASRAEQMAFWINAYNAVTVKGILQEYPTSSIRNHTSENGGYNIWKDLLLNVGGRQISLDSIEHKALRPMGDPRIHFAIVCASKGCPRLLNEAYTGEKLDVQLDVNAKHFFSIAQNFQYDQQARSFKLSAIMQWFGTDFGADQAAQLNAIAKYLPSPQAQAAAKANAVRVSYLDYSWDLNEQPKVVMKKIRRSANSPSGSGTKTEALGSGTKK